MTMQIEAVYDGEVLRPEKPLDLPPHVKVSITIETSERSIAEPYAFLDAALSLNLPGPTDWSANLREYLYPNPK